MRNFDVPTVPFSRVVLLLLQTTAAYRLPFACAVVAHLLLAIVEGLIASLVVPLLAVTTDDSPPASLIGAGFAPLLEGRDFGGALQVIAGILLGLVVLKFAVGFAADYFSRRLAEDAARDLRLRVMTAYLRQPYATFLARKQGQIVNDMVSEPSLVAQSIVDLSSLGRNLLALLAYGAVGAMVYWPGIAALTVLVPVVVLSHRLLARRMSTLSENAVRHRRESMAYPVEVVGGIRQVLVFSAENRVLARYRDLLTSESSTSLRLARLVSLTTQVVPLIVMCGAAVALFLVGGAGVGRSEMLQTAFPMLAISFRSLPILSSLGVLKAQVESRGASIGVTHSILDSDRRPPPRGVQAPAPTLRRGIVLDRVAFAYEAGRPVLSDVSFEILAGQITAITGPSGAGKSTIIDLIVRLYDCSSGRILVDGLDLANVDRTAWLERIGFVSQDALIFHGTIAENIAFGLPDASHAEIEAAARQANAASFISELSDGYETIVGDRGLKLSGGQRQRIAIARALVRKPNLLIFDEATSSLDNESEALVQQAINELARSRSVILVTHRLSTIRAADKIVVLDGGRVIEQGSHAELMSRHGLYRNLHNVAS